MRQLEVSIASASQAGIKAANEDAVAVEVPQAAHLLEFKGAVVTLADGVSSAEAGKEASNTAVRQFIDDYYQTPETWTVAHAGEKTLTAINLALFKKSHEFIQDIKGYLCTFDGLVIKSTTAHFFHIGDSRIYHFRDGVLQQLTRDHVAQLQKGSPSLSRAVGMDSNLSIDYGTQNLCEGDIFLLSSDGVHDFVEHQVLVDTLATWQGEPDAAEQLVQLALQNGSDDNLSCVFVRIDQLPKQSIDDLNSHLTRLPFPPPLEAGMKLDGYRVKGELFASSRSQLYLVENEDSGDVLVMKTPSVNFVDDTHYIDRFIQEEWIGKRIDSPHVVKIIHQDRPRTFLYYLMEWVHGVTLAEWIEANPHPKPKRAIGLVKQISQGLQAFHDKQTVHQDLKPGNILVNQNDEVKIVDFGSVFVAGIAEMFSPIQHEGSLGTATYSDPNYLWGHNSGVRGDVYALATITYEMFTGHLPYGEAIEHCHSRFDFDRLRYRSASVHNPVVPVWFDRALEKGVAIDMNQRYATLPELLKDLTHPNPDFLLVDPKVEGDQSKLLFWQLLSGFWVMMLIMFIALFSSQ